MTTHLHNIFVRLYSVIITNTKFAYTMSQVKIYVMVVFPVFKNSKF